MGSAFPFGNDPAKIGRYRAFWSREEVTRPWWAFFQVLVPLQEFGASAAWQERDYLTPDMVVPEAFLDDQERLLQG